MAQFQKNDEYDTPSYAVYLIMGWLKAGQQCGARLTRQIVSL